MIIKMSMKVTQEEVQRAREVARFYETMVLAMTDEHPAPVQKVLESEKKEGTP